MTQHATSHAAVGLSVHVVSHTHWDREWYQPAARFRQRLVTLIDELIDQPPRDGESFLLDGQAVVLEDYLAVRPERREALCALLASGRIEAGPWYVLADNLIPSGEALVRNRLLGRRIVRALGGDALRVTYAPDSFGHPAALPAIARGFGDEIVIAWRGYGGKRWPRGDSAIWTSPDGEAALLYHLPPSGYEFGVSLPVGESQLRARWVELETVLGGRASLGIALVLNGADHHARQAHHDDAVDALVRIAAPCKVTASSLGAAAAGLCRRAASASLPVVTGELRDSYGYTWTLQGTFSTRAQQKRRNAVVERLLTREAEPWAAMAKRLEQRNFGPVLRAAWATLLRVHPHDTLCGCATDEVARAADARLDSALAQAEGVRDDALSVLVRHDADAARERPPDWQSIMVVRNATARPRAGVAEVSLLVKIRDVPVGPGSGAARGANTSPGAVEIASGTVPFQVLNTARVHDRLDSMRHYPDDDLVERRRGVAWLTDSVPGYGTTCYPVGGAAAAIKPVLPSGVLPVTARRGVLRNNQLSLEFDAKGRARIRFGSTTLNNLLVFEHVGDRGDLYTHSAAGRPITGARFRSQAVTHRGPLRAAMEQEWTLRVPSSLGAHTMVTIRLAVCWSLDAGAGYVREAVRGINTAQDHRLRIGIRTGITNPRVIADAAFWPVERMPIVVDREDRAMECPPTTAPLHRYVSLYDRDRGCTLYSDGLAEYEAANDGTAWVTLVRGVAELSRSDLPERPGHAGWPASTPEAQCPGIFDASFAVLPHGNLSETATALVARTADDVLVPLQAVTIRSALHLPAPSQGIELEGDGLVLSSIKDSDNGDWIVLRCVNLFDRETAGTWRCGFAVTEARDSRLDETPMNAARVEHGCVIFNAGPKALVTILVR